MQAAPVTDTISNRLALGQIVAVSAVVAVADQLTKLAALDYMSPGELIPVIDGFFNLTLVFNKGAAFGMFAGLEDGTRHLALGTATVVALGAVLFFLFREFKRSATSRYSLALVLGGALGNVYDRIFRGQVVDFLDFYYGSYHWPAFNVADSAICVGVGILLLFGAKNSEQPTQLQQEQERGN